jgi:hypothetical protein
VARGKRRKTEAEEMYLSTEVVPAHEAARSSRIASERELGASVVCGSNEKRFSSWHIARARQARQWFDGHQGNPETSTTVTTAA